MTTLKVPIGVLSSVLMVMTDEAPLTPGMTVAGTKVQLEWLGRWEQDKATGLANEPPSEVTLIVKLTECPRTTDFDATAGAIAKSMPVPLKGTLCGLPAALSLINNAPVRFPYTDGTKVTLIRQLDPAAREAPQALDCVKSPEIVTALNESVALPVLVSITVCAGLAVATICPANNKLPGERETTGAGTYPVPLKETVSAPPEALATVKLPVRVPPLWG